MDNIAMNSNGVAPNSIQNLTKINDLQQKNHSSIQRLNDLDERLDLAKISEVSRRARHINFHCQNELVYTLNQANLNEYSYTLRLLFQIFGLSEEQFVENYVGYMSYYFSEMKNLQDKDDVKAIKGKDLSRMAKNDPRANFAKNDESEVKTSIVPRYDFEEKTQAQIAEKMRQREIYVEDRVKKLLMMWNKTKATDEFEKEQDPMVILGIQKHLHAELSEDFKTNLEGMSRYLTKKEANFHKKTDYGALTTHLTKMQTIMVQVANRDTVFGLSGLIDEDSNRETLIEIQSCLLECFDLKQRKLIIILIKKMLGLHQGSMKDNDTQTGIYGDAGVVGQDGVPVAEKFSGVNLKKGKHTLESLEKAYDDLRYDFK